MNLPEKWSNGDLFGTPTVPTLKRLVLELKGIAIEPSKMRQDKERPEEPQEPREPNYHIPSFKNSKRWVTKDPRGRQLERPLLISDPAFQRWKAQAVSAFESQWFSACQTACGGTLPEPSRLLLMLSSLPADDSVNDLVEGQWRVEIVPPGSEGALITLEVLD